MKFPRMTVRNLMLAVLAFAAAWWIFETAARRESYHLKAARHARRVKQLRSFQDGWVGAIDRADRLLKTDGGRRDVEEVERLNQWVDNLLERYSCSAVDFEFIGLIDPTDPTGWDEGLRRVIATSRRNLSVLEPLLAYHEPLREQYERAEKRPWRKVPPDPPMPSTSDSR
jgi:hypothetical protein